MSAAIPYKGDVTLSFGVSDLGAAIRWYQERLGFRLLYRQDELGWCELQGPGESITVGLGQRESLAQGGGCVPVWGVRDIAAARAGLEAAGVRFDGPTREIPGLVKLATFYDPDGNAMMFAESLATPAA